MAPAFFYYPAEHAHSCRPYPAAVDARKNVWTGLALYAYNIRNMQGDIITGGVYEKVKVIVHMCIGIDSTRPSIRRCIARHRADTLL